MGCGPLLLSPSAVGGAAASSRAALSFGTFGDDGNVLCSPGQEPHVAIEHLKRGYCNRGAEFQFHLILIKINLYFNSHMWLVTNL